MNGCCSQWSVGPMKLVNTFQSWFDGWSTPRTMDGSSRCHMAPSHAIIRRPDAPGPAGRTPAVAFHKRCPATTGAYGLPCQGSFSFLFMKGTSENYKLYRSADGFDTTKWTDGRRGVGLVCRNLKQEPVNGFPEERWRWSGTRARNVPEASLSVRCSPSYIAVAHLCF